MKEVVRAKCPKCQNVLTIPAEWADRTVKCKHCGNQLQARKKATPGPVSQSPPKNSPPMAVPPPQPAKPVSPVTASPAWEPLPEYSPPAVVPAAAPRPHVEPIPTPAPEGKSTYVTAFDTRDRYSGRGSYKGPKSGAWLKYAIFGVLFVGLVGGAGAVYKYRPDLFSPPSGELPKEQTIAENKAGVPVGGGSTDTVTGIFPRRMLAISIHSYLYANPLHNGEMYFATDDSKNSGTDAAVRRLAERWRIPNDQIYHLTDAPTRDEKMAAKMPKKKADMDAPVVRTPKSVPLKMVMEGAITNFADSCREQDRVVFVFCGHAFEKDGKVFLLPLEGDFEEPETLIPLEWFYEKVGACKAQEKLVIFDVCRFHPDRGLERPHSGVMSEGLEKALHESPEGVSVITTCSKGEYSYEVDYYAAKNGLKAQVTGGIFVSLFQAASAAGYLSPEGKLPGPADPLPEERLMAFMGEKLPDLVKDQFSGKTQTPKVTIKRRETSLAYNPSEPVPGKMAYPTPPPSADPKMIASILREIEVPSVKAFREDAAQTKVSDVMPFKEETLKEYQEGILKADDTPNEFQKAILTAVDEMRKLREAGNGNELPESFVGESSDAAKNALKRVQEVPAKVEVILREQLEELEIVAEMRDKQTKRWQAHYDYTLAQVKFRICYANQYNLALANFRSGKVPDLTGDQNGYRLTAETTLDKNTAKEYKTMFDDAKKALNELVKSHPQTPWALLSKGDRTVAIGLRLTPSSVR